MPKVASQRADLFMKSRQLLVDKLTFEYATITLSGDFWHRLAFDAQADSSRRDSSTKLL